MISIGILKIHLQLPGCMSLKEKRSILKPLLARLHRQFNISAAEIDLQDHWQETIIACSLVSNGQGFTQKSLQAIPPWIENNWPNLTLIDDQLELIH